MKDKILPITDTGLLLGYSDSVYRNAIIQAYSKEKASVEIRVRGLDLESLKEQTENMEIVKEKTLKYQCKKPYQKGSYSYLYRKGTDHEKIELDLLNIPYVHAYSVVNIFITTEKDSSKFIEDDNVFKVGVFGKKGLFCKLNNAFIPFAAEKYEKYNHRFRRIRLEYDDNLARIYIVTDTGHNILMQEYMLPKQFSISPTIIGINVDFGYDIYYDWLLSNYIQLYVKCDSFGKKVLDFWSQAEKDYWSSVDNYFLDCGKLYSHETDIIAGTKRIDKVVQKMLKASIYVELELDMFYIECSEYYGNWHEYKKVLVYGFSKKHYYYLYYDKAGLQKEKIKKKIFVKGVSKSGPIIMLRYAPDEIIYSFDCKRVIYQIQDYLKNENAYIKYSENTSREDVSFGIDSQRRIAEREVDYKNLCENPENLNILIVHKELMCQRITLLHDKKLLVDNEYEEMYRCAQRVCQQMKKAKEGTIKQSEGIDMTIEYLNEKMNEITQMEEEYLKKLIEILRRNA